MVVLASFHITPSYNARWTDLRHEWVNDSMKVTDAHVSALQNKEAPSSQYTHTHTVLPPTAAQ